MKEIDRFRQWLVEQPLKAQLEWQSVYEEQMGKKAIWRRIYPRPFFDWFKRSCGGKKPWDVIPNV